LGGRLLLTLQNQAFPTDTAFREKPAFLQQVSTEPTWRIGWLADRLSLGSEISGPVSKSEENQHGATALI
jgi:hypothetical protein